MVEQQYPQRYRWDFIGLSTDDKPTQETSEKVVNGSTFYCSDTSKLYVFCDGEWYERKPLGEGGGGTEYTAGDGIDITNDVISVSYGNFTGTDGSTAGTTGLVPAPATTDADKFLKSDGTWAEAGGSGPAVVQSYGNSTSSVMSQNAVTRMIYPTSNNYNKIIIGPSNDFGGIASSQITLGTGKVDRNYGICIALGTGADVPRAAAAAVAVGYGANADAQGAIALGAKSHPVSQGEMNIGTSNTSYGYNNTNYRLISGVHDGADDHDAVNVGQINALIDAINTALSTNIPHIGA